MERLTAREGRVVASLVEKQLTIPQHYPLTLNALVAACNQSTSRDPVTAYSEQEVLDAVESLRAKRMVRAVLPSHGRSVVRYRHVLDETFGLDAAQLAVLAVLELRGPQTVGELRARTERMAAIDSVDHELSLLAGREEALAAPVARRPGQKEDRWESLLSEPIPRHSRGESPGVEPATATARPLAAPDGRAASPGDAGEAGDAGETEKALAGTLRREIDELRHDVGALRAEIESLRAGLEAVRSGLDELRASLGE